MRVLVFEPDLFWSARLVQTLARLGHSAVSINSGEWFGDGADCAIVNLGVAEATLREWVLRLKERGIAIIGHAGHKETVLREMGRALGCDRIASNSELTFRLDSLLAEIAANTTPAPSRS